MRDRKFLYRNLIILVIVVLGAVRVMAQEPEEETESSPKDISITAVVSSKISYQGVLKENGNLVTGSRNMVFRFYINNTCSAQVQAIPQNNVSVNGGVFSINLPVTPTHFNGQGLWLRVEVSGATIVSCQEIIAVPYALSLRPGAIVSNTTTGGPIFYAYNSAPTGYSTGLYGLSRSSGGNGIIGENTATSGSANGVSGFSSAPDGSGVFGYATNTNPGSNQAADGVFGLTDSPTGSGVLGWATNTTPDPGQASDGVFGRTDSPTGSGVFGWATNTTLDSEAAGVSGEASSQSGHGGYFYNSNSAGVALKAESSSSSANVPIIEADSASGRVFYVASNGDVVIDGDFSTAGADFAEMLPAVEGLEPGDVLVIGQDGNLTRSLQPHQTSVVGVYSTQPGFLGGATEAETIGQVPLAMIGRVPVKASAENGPIQPGDLLAASAIPGHAMKAGANPPAGSVIGKALAPLEEGTGLIQMLVILQ